jgi:hypothetical protein
MEISNTLFDLGMLAIREIPQLPKMTQEVLAAASLILVCLREEHASGTGPWDRNSGLLSFEKDVIYIYTYHTHTHTYIYIGKACVFTPLCPQFPTVASWGPGTQVGHATPPWRGVPIVDHHDHIFPTEWHHVSSARIFLEFHVLGEGA